MTSLVDSKHRTLAFHIALAIDQAVPQLLAQDRVRVSEVSFVWYDAIPDTSKEITQAIGRAAIDQSSYRDIDFVLALDTLPNQQHTQVTMYMYLTREDPDKRLRCSVPLHLRFSDMSTQ